MYIDIYTHIFPNEFYENMTRVAPSLGNIGKRMKSVAEVHDLEARFRAMDPFGDYHQIISLPNPPLEDITSPEQGIELARIGNDTMAEMVEKNPDRFPGFVAALAMHSMDETMDELHRAVRDLGAVGAQIFTNVGGRPLDHPDYEPVFAAMAEYDLPIWMHPARTSDMTDYAAEEKSRYEIWWALGWLGTGRHGAPRTVGAFDRYPNIKILTYLGGMIFRGTVGAGLSVLGARTAEEDYSEVLSSSNAPMLNTSRCSTATRQCSVRLRRSLRGRLFRRRSRVLFYRRAVRGGETFESLKRMELEADVQAKIYKQNAERLMNRSLIERLLRPSPFTRKIRRNAWKRAVAAPCR